MDADAQVLQDMAKLHETRLELAMELPEPLLTDKELLTVGEALARAVERVVVKWHAAGRPNDWWSDIASLLCEKLRLRSCCCYFSCACVPDRRAELIRRIAKVEACLDVVKKKHPGVLA